MTKVIFTAGNLFIDYGRAAVPPEVERTVTAAQVDGDVRTGFGHWDSVANRLRAGPPPDIEAPALKALLATERQDDIWLGRLVLAGPDIFASGKGHIDAAHQARRLIWTDAVVGMGPIPLLNKLLIFRAYPEGAANIPNVPAFVAAADAGRAFAAPTMAQMWINALGQAVNLEAPVIYGPLNSDWKSYDWSWAVSRTHAA